MRHSWLIAVTADPEAISRRVLPGRTITLRRLPDGRTIVIATTPDVIVRGDGDRIVVDPIRGVTIASIDTKTGQVRARRTLFSVQEAYWTATEGRLLLSGVLADLLPHVGPRQFSQHSIVDHHLFRWVPAERTYLDGVFQLLPGHELQWNGQGPGKTKQLQSGSDFTSDERRPLNRESVELQVEALRQAIAPQINRTVREDRAVLLSGGIDSSVLQMVMEGLDHSVPLQTRSFILDTPEWLDEQDYCQEAVRIFGTEHRYTRISPADYPKLLTDSISILGKPFGHDSEPGLTGLFKALGATGPTTLWSGEAADSVYGHWGANWINPHYGYLPRPLLWTLGIALHPFWPKKAQGALSTAQMMGALRRGESRPEHPANIQGRYCDFDTVTRWFGEQMIGEAMASRRELVTLLAGPTSELVRIQMIALFTSALYGASMDFQLGAAADCTLLNPYLDEGVIRAALRVDSAQRYIYRGKTKPLLKLALQERTGPDFVARPKRGGGFYTDLCAWMRDGVLADMVHSIERPAFADLKSFQQKLKTPDWTTWNLLLMDLYTKHLRSLSAVANRIFDDRGYAQLNGTELRKHVPATE
jgi:asparagine synthetase B (glutamine-hydrolysing)